MAHYQLVPVNDVGGYKQWTPSSGTAHYALIDELIANKNSADYNKAEAGTLHDRYYLSYPPIDEYPPEGLPANIITALRVYFYIEGLYYSKYPTLYVTIRLGATVLASQAYGVPTDGAFHQMHIDFTGLSIAAGDLNSITINLQAYETDTPVDPMEGD